MGGGVGVVAEVENDTSQVNVRESQSFGSSASSNGVCAVGIEKVTRPPKQHLKSSSLWALFP